MDMDIELDIETENGNSNNNNANNNNDIIANETSNTKLLLDDDTEEDLKTQFLNTLYDYHLNNFLSDAVVRLQDGGTFHIHRAILSACSPYFRTLFTTTLHSPTKTECNLPGVDSEIMINLLEYAYRRNLNVTHENVCQLYVTADYLSIFDILKLCCQYVKRNFTPKNCIGIFKFAREYHCLDLKAEAYKYIIVYITEIIEQNPEIVTLQFDDFQSIIGAYNLNVKDEEIVWELVVKWIDHDPDARKKYILELMKNIRLGLLNTEYFLERVRVHPYVYGNEECRPLIIETLKFLYDLEMITLKDNAITTPMLARPRIPHEILFTIGGYCANNATNFIETYDSRAARWIEVEERDPGPLRAFHGTAVIGFDIYVIGGFSGTEWYNTCRKFNAVTKEWTEIAPMHSERAYVSVAVLNDVIYAMGGSSSSYRLKTAEKYDYKRNQWTMISRMNRRRSDACATVLNNKIYITGGCSGTENLRSAEVYDPETDTWTLLPDMRSLRSSCSCIAYRDHIYVIGGCNGTSRLFTGEKYNPETRTWTPIANMSIDRSNFGIAVIDDMIFAIGGYNGSTTLRHVECYSAETNDWCEVTDMNLQRSGASSCVVMGLPNVSDYIHKHRERLMEEKRQKMLALERQKAQMQSRYVQIFMRQYM